jgi:2-methylisocitrate lyase-like PEP mutase family enzyme
MSTIADEFLALHVPGTPLLIPNPWDVGSAKLLVSLGFDALATTSSGFAMTLGRLDGSVTRAEALAHAAQIVEAVDVPVSADLENCFADDPDGVAGTIRDAAATGLAGCSIEDWSGTAIYPAELAVARVRAAAEAAHGGERRLVLTARAENHLHGRDDSTAFADTIARLQAYQGAGADVLYAPGITDADRIRTVVSELDRPVNVLAMPAGPPVADLAAAGVARISVGGSFAFAATGALVEAARELLERGTYSYAGLAATGRGAIGLAFG